MIDKTLLKETIVKAIEGTSIFLVDLQVNPGNSIVVEIDSPEGIDIDTCADITRKIEAEFDRDKEDYELEVGSAGLTSPFKVKGQYLKNVGNQVEVLTNDGKKIKGTLTAVNVDDDTFIVETVKKVKEPGKKKPVETVVPETFAMDGCKYVKYLIDFK